MSRKERVGRLTTPELLRRIKKVEANIAENLRQRDEARDECRDVVADRFCEQSHIREGWRTSYLGELKRRPVVA
jgi:hypothetical protein